MSRARLVRALAALVVSGGLLFALFALIDAGDVARRLARVEPVFVAASFVASLAVLLARGLRFTLLADRAPFAVTTAAVSVQNFLNRITPFRLGELSLPYLLARHAGESAARALLALLLVRLFELWMMLVVALAAALVLFGTGAAAHLALAVGGLTLALALFRHWLVRLVRFGGAVARLLRVDRVGPVRGGLASLERAATGAERLDRRRRLALAGGTLLVLSGQYVLYYLLVRAFGVELEPTRVVLGATLASAAGSLPVASVGSLGTHETGWVAGMVWAGMPLEDAVVTAVGSQLLTLAWAAVFAVPGWLRLRRGGVVAPAG